MKKTSRLVAAAGAVLICAAAVATPAHQMEFAKLVKPKKDSPLAKGACAVCHVGMKKDLNPFGKDLSAAMTKLKTKTLTMDVLKQVAKLDSDGDKATNEAEAKAGTLPGDPKSKPGK
jgi:hypothetical protein